MMQSWPCLLWSNVEVQGPLSGSGRWKPFSLPPHPKWKNCGFSGDSWKHSQNNEHNVFSRVGHSVADYFRRDTDDDGWAGRAPLMNTFVKRPWFFDISLEFTKKIVCLWWTAKQHARLYSTDILCCFGMFWIVLVKCCLIWFSKLDMTGPNFITSYCKLS